MAIMTMMTMTQIFGLLLGVATILWSGTKFSSSPNKLVCLSGILLGGAFVVLAILLLSGVPITPDP